MCMYMYGRYEGDLHRRRDGRKARDTRRDWHHLVVPRTNPETERLTSDIIGTGGTNM